MSLLLHCSLEAAAVAVVVAAAVVVAFRHIQELHSSMSSVVNPVVVWSQFAIEAAAVVVVESAFVAAVEFASVVVVVGFAFAVVGAAVAFDIVVVVAEWLGEAFAEDLDGVAAAIGVAVNSEWGSVAEQHVDVEPTAAAAAGQQSVVADALMLGVAVAVAAE